MLQQTSTRNSHLIARPFFLVTGLLLLILVTSGCGPSRPKTIAVSGTITFAGGPPPAEGAIYFAPITAAEGFDKRPGRARFDTSGKFRATSFEEGDGLVPGTYSVRIECWKSPPTMDSAIGDSYIPAGFTAPQIDVPIRGGRLTYDVNVTAAEQP